MRYKKSTGFFVKFSYNFEIVFVHNECLVLNTLIRMYILYKCINAHRS